MSKPYPCGEACAPRCWSCFRTTGIQLLSTDIDACCQEADGTYLWGTYINSSGSPTEGDCGLNVKNTGELRIAVTKTLIDCTDPVEDCYECIPDVTDEFSLEPPFVELCGSASFLGSECCTIYELLILQHVHVRATIGDVLGVPTVEIIVEHRYALITYNSTTSAITNCNSIRDSSEFWVLTDTYRYAGVCGSIPSEIEHVDRTVSATASQAYDETEFVWGAGANTYTFCDPLEVTLVLP